MKSKKLPFLTLFPIAMVCLLVFYHCTYENEEDKYMAEMVCDTANVSYSSDIQPILTDHCYSCHMASFAASVGGGIILDSYEEVNKNAEKVLKSVQHAAGFEPMPKNAPKLDDCTIAKIKIWVEAGAKNN